MIKHELKDNIIFVSIDKMDFSYRIPLKKIGNRIDWRIGEKGTNGIVIKDVSTWTLQLFTKNPSAEKYMNQFKTIVQELTPNNAINWDETFEAVKVQNEYNSRVKENLKAGKKISDDEILSLLEEKYKLA